MTRHRSTARPVDVPRASVEPAGSAGGADQPVTSRQVQTAAAPKFWPAPVPGTATTTLAVPRSASAAAVTCTVSWFSLS